MIPICLITGFLGTGKTTLLKRIISENCNKKWIYLINEFSVLDVDGAIVSEEHPNVVSIPGGSIFCKCLVTEFIGQMTQINEQYTDVEGVVIEASGMADPRVIVDMLKETGLSRYFELKNIISIVEPRSFLRLIHTLPNIIHQVEAADCVLLNKCDLFSEEQLLETEKAVKKINNHVSLIRCVKSDADFSVLESRSERFELHGEYAKCRDPRYSSFACTFSEPIDLDQLSKFILKNEASIYRVKGYLQSLDGPVYFDYSTAGFSIEPSEQKPEYGLAWIVGEGVEKILNEEIVYATFRIND